MATTNNITPAEETKATLINQETGDRQAVITGSSGEKELFSKGYQLETSSPTTGKATFQTGAGQRVEAVQGSQAAQNMMASGATPEVKIYEGSKTAESPVIGEQPKAETNATEKKEAVNLVFQKDGQDVAVDMNDKDSISKLREQGFKMSTEIDANIENNLFSSAQQQVKDISDAKIAILEEKSRALDEYGKNLDARNKSMIESIKQSYAVRKNQQDQINNAMLSGMRVRGFLSGRARYASDYQAQLLTEEESAGISRMAALDAQEMDLISQAEAAATDKQFSLLNEKFNALLEVQDAKANQLVELNKMAEAEQERQLALLESAREQEKFELDKLQAFTEMDREDRLLEIKEKQFNLDTEKLLSDITGTFRGQPTYKAEQDQLKNMIDVAGLTGEFMGAATLDEKKRVADQAFREFGMSLDKMKFEELLKDNEFQRGIAEAKYNLDYQKFISEDQMRQMELLEKQLSMGNQQNANNGEYTYIDDKQARSIDNEIANNKVYKAQISTKEVLAALDNYEKLFDDNGLSYFSGEDRGEINNAYENLKMNLKTFYELGAITGPDMQILESMLPNPTRDGFWANTMAVGSLGIQPLLKRKEIKAAIETQRKMVNDYIKLNTSYLLNQYGEYNPDQIGTLKTVDEIFKSSFKFPKTVDEYYAQYPNNRKAIEALITDNPNFSDEDILQILDSSLMDYTLGIKRPSNSNNKSVSEESSNDYPMTKLNDENRAKIESSLGIQPNFKQDLGKSLNGLGSLSEKFESAGDPGAIGYDKVGGYSYGAYQLIGGNASRFISKSSFSKDFEGLTPGTKEFDKKWKDVAEKNPDKFKAEQKNFINSTHFQPQINKLAKANIPVDKFSETLKDVIWSTAVQHGANTNVVEKAYQDARKILKREPSEPELIVQIYNERWANGERFRSSTDSVKNSVKNRFKNERALALARYNIKA
jgi:hypothetical protein